MEPLIRASEKTVIEFEAENLYFSGFSYNKKKDDMKDILEEAGEVINGAKRWEYGHPYENYKKIAEFWKPILGFEPTWQQIAMCMIGLKMAREMHSAKRDNLVDIAGYARTIEMCLEHEKWEE